jgi:hypothetical protein
VAHVGLRPARPACSALQGTVTERRPSLGVGYRLIRPRAGSELTVLAPAAIDGGLVASCQLGLESRTALLAGARPHSSQSTVSRGGLVATGWCRCSQLAKFA